MFVGLPSRDVDHPRGAKVRVGHAVALCGARHLREGQSSGGCREERIGVEESRAYAFIFVASREKHKLRQELARSFRDVRSDDLLGEQFL